MGFLFKSPKMPPPPPPPPSPPPREIVRTVYAPPPPPKVASIKLIFLLAGINDLTSSSITGI